MSSMTTTAEDPSHPVDLQRLLAEFFPNASLDRSPLGSFQRREELPSPHDRLLDHDGHMTETVEAYYGGPVEVTVLEHHETVDPVTGTRWYCREITLVETNHRRTVQYGLVRLSIDSLQPKVWERIESRQTPLGRVLIEHDVLRRVELKRLWRIVAGPVLVEHLQVPTGTDVFGRTALIHCDGKPAIELLEIVTPPA